MALGAIFVGGVAVSGCGSAVPGNAVAVVAGNSIGSRTLAHWSYVAAVGQSTVSPGSPLIIPDPPTYKKCIKALKHVAPATIPESELKSACVSQYQQTIEYLIRTDWLQGQAASLGLKVTQAQVMAKFNSAKNQQFKTQTAYAAFLKQTGQTEQDILYRFRISLLAQKLATPSAVAAYYHAHQAVYTTPERRNLQIILTKKLATANAAKAALGHQSWAAVAKRYSVDPATKNSGGVLSAVVNGEEPTALNTAIFAAAQGKLIGPLKTPFGYYLAKVTKILPASTVPLAKEEATIKSTIANSALSSPPWEKKWKAKTVCRAGFAIADCSNYVAPKPAKTPTTATPTTGSTTPATGSTTPTPTVSTPTTTTTTKK